MALSRCRDEVGVGLASVAVGAQELQVGQVAGAARDVVDLCARQAALDAEAAVAFPDRGPCRLGEAALGARVASGEHEGGPEPQRLADIFPFDAPVPANVPPVADQTRPFAAGIGAEEVVPPRRRQRGEAVRARVGFKETSLDPGHGQVEEPRFPRGGQPRFLEVPHRMLSVSPRVGTGRAYAGTAARLPAGAASRTDADFRKDPLSQIRSGKLFHYTGAGAGF